MKTEFPLHSLIFFLFLFVFPTSNLAQELHDADGQTLRNGGSYYILPAFRGKGGGGLELAKTEGETCPLTVVQAPSETSRGWPATIWTPPLIAILTPGFYLNIEFRLEDPSACHEESRLQWKVEEGSRVVKIASKEEERLFGPFQIHPYRDNYKLLYCERVSEGNSDHCKDLGISIDDQNNRRLVVKDGEPLAVQFVKANRRGDEYARMSNV